MSVLEMVGRGKVPVRAVAGQSTKPNKDQLGPSCPTKH